MTSSDDKDKIDPATPNSPAAAPVAEIMPAAGFTPAAGDATAEGIAPAVGIATDKTTAPATATAPATPQPLQLRWRVHEGQLPLRQRHLRSLEPLNLPHPLLGWVHERLEWALANMLSASSEGVLVLSIDPATEVTMSLDMVRETPSLSSDDLIVKEGFITGVQQGGSPLEGSVWLERDGMLYASCQELTTATGTLARDLAQTFKLPVSIRPQRPEDTRQAALFLISDEHGFVPIQPASNCAAAPATAKLQECFSKLW